MPSEMAAFKNAGAYHARDLGARSHFAGRHGSPQHNAAPVVPPRYESAQAVMQMFEDNRTEFERITQMLLHRDDYLWKEPDSGASYVIFQYEFGTSHFREERFLTADELADLKAFFDKTALWYTRCRFGRGTEGMNTYLVFVFFLRTSENDEQDTMTLYYAESENGSPIKEKESPYPDFIGQRIDDYWFSEYFTHD